VITPATGKKKEYHKRVSPIVRKGGLSNEIHIPTIKAENITKPNTVQATAPLEKEGR
jgi:hypothetical protein